MHLRAHLPLLTTTILWLQAAVGPASGLSKPFTITADVDYANLRACGKSCLWESDQYWVGVPLGCAKPWVDDCFCRLDLATVVSSHATSCLRTLCTMGAPENDISSFLGLYNGYCARNGYTLTAAAAAVPKATLTIGDPNSPTITRVIVATVTAVSGGTPVVITTTTVLGKSLAMARLLAAPAMVAAFVVTW